MNKHYWNIKGIHAQLVKTLLLPSNWNNSNWHRAYYFLKEWSLLITGHSSRVKGPGNKRRREWAETAIIFSANKNLREYKTTQYVFSLFKQRL